MSANNYTYEDAVKANETHKRDIVDLGYVYEGDTADWDPQPFIVDIPECQTIYGEDVDLAIYPFIDGDFCTQESGESLDHYLERVCFDPRGAKKEKDKEILKDLNEMEEIYLVTIVNENGEPVAYWYLTEVSAGSTFDTPEEAIELKNVSYESQEDLVDHWIETEDPRDDNSNSYWRRIEVKHNDMHIGVRGFRSMDDLNDFCSRHEGFEVTAISYSSNGYSTDFPDDNYCEDHGMTPDPCLSWDKRDGIDLYESLFNQFQVLDPSEELREEIMERRMGPIWTMRL